MWAYIPNSIQHEEIPFGCDFIQGKAYPVAASFTNTPPDDVPYIAMIIKDEYGIYRTCRAKDDHIIGWHDWRIVLKPRIRRMGVVG